MKPYHSMQATNEERDAIQRQEDARRAREETAKRETYAEYSARIREGNGENARRLRLEDEITRALVRHLDRAGWSAVEVDDGGEVHQIERGTQAAMVADVLDRARAVDEAHVYFRKRRALSGTSPAAHPRHWVFFVYGNGVDVITDHSYTEGDPDGFAAAMDAFDVDKVRAA